MPNTVDSTEPLSIQSGTAASRCFAVWTRVLSADREQRSLGLGRKDEESERDSRSPKPRRAETLGRRGSRLKQSRTKQMTEEEFVTALSSNWIAERPKAITSPAVNRSQVQAAFVSSYLPKNRVRYPQFEWMSNVASGSRAMHYALDAWCLSEVGRQQGDVDIKRTAALMHAQALRHMILEINAKERNVGLLIGTVYILQTCDFFANLTAGSPQWRIHIHAMLPLLTASDAQSLDVGIQSMTQWNCRWFLLWDALLSRKRIIGFQVFVDDPNDPFKTHLAELSELSFRVPGVLEDCDTLRQQTAAELIEGVADVLRKLVELEFQLHAWMTASYRRTPEMRPIRIRSEDATFAAFNSESQMFPYLYDLCDYSSTLSHQVQWLALLTLGEAHWDVFKTLGEHMNADGLQQQRLEKLCEDYADSLCMSVAFLRKCVNGTWALLATVGPLYFASLHYRKHGKLEKLAWCANAAMELEQQGIRTPFSRHVDGESL